ncbi:MAG TPA: acyl-CoA dehydrogenase family protein, partial [Actinomycetes bacterium]
MSRLAQTEGLTDVQQEIVKTVREFVDKEILPVATELEHGDEYPQAIVDGMKEMGLFGLMIPEEYGGLGESLLTYALVVEELSRGWMSVSGIINTHFIVAYLLKQHGTEEQKQHYLPRMARLAQTDGLTDVQKEILSAVKTFVDKEIIPYATELEHKDEFPEAIVEGMKEMGLFGLMIDEEYGGLGESLLTYALVVEQIAR